MRPKTLERYRQLAGYVLDATEGEPAALAANPLADLRHNAVEAALRALLRMPAKRRAHLAPKTVREIASVLSVPLNEAFRLDKIVVNPFLKVRLPKVERRDARALSPDAGTAPAQRLPSGLDVHVRGDQPSHRGAPGNYSRSNGRMSIGSTRR